MALHSKFQFAGTLQAKQARCALCFLAFISTIAPDIARAEPVVTTRAIQVEHVTIVSQKSFDAVKSALESRVPRLNADYRVLLQNDEIEGAKAKLESGPTLSIFINRDHGGLLQIAGQPRKAIQYEIGNPLTASKMTRHQLAAALYAPLRVLLYENEAGHAVFEYDKPSALFDQFGDDKVTAIARDLDGALESALRHSAE